MFLNRNFAGQEAVLRFFLDLDFSSSTGGCWQRDVFGATSMLTVRNIIFINNECVRSNQTSYLTRHLSPSYALLPSDDAVKAKDGHGHRCLDVSIHKMAGAIADRQRRWPLF